MKKYKNFINIILNFVIVCTSFLLAVIIFIDVQSSIMKKNYSTILGYSIFEIKSGSMSGKLNVGDWILVKNTKQADLGDIVTYEDESGNFITHRVVQKYNNIYVTKGDSNNTIDSPITGTQIVGKLAKTLPKIGIIKNVFLSLDVLIPFIITIILLCLIIDDKEDHDKSYVSKALNIFKKKKKKATIPDIKEIPSNNDLSMTTVLSKVEVVKNNEIINNIKPEEQKKDEDTPEIIQIL